MKNPLKNLSRLLLIIVLIFGSFSTAVATAEDSTAEENSEVGITPAVVLIPRLDLFTQIEAVGITADGAMDTPTDWKEVAWYEPGYTPGETGHAVFAGHLDWAGNTGPFWRLHTLETGDLIAVADENGRVLVFSVTDNSVYSRLAQDASNLVFGPADIPSLSLITCEGEFVASKDTYNDRRVVTATLIFDSMDRE